MSTKAVRWCIVSCSYRFAATEWMSEGTMIRMQTMKRHMKNQVSQLRDIEIWVKGHSRLLEIAPFSRSHMSSYWRSVVTGHILLYFLDKARCWSKITIFSYTLHSTPPFGRRGGGGHRQNITITFGTEKLHCGARKLHLFIFAITLTNHLIFP